MTVVLSDMTLKSLLDISKIPCDSNQTYENKIKLLKNANILLKDENYSNNIESLQHQELTKQAGVADFLRLLAFWDRPNLIGTVLYNPSTKYQEGLMIECKCKTEIKKDVDTNQPISIYQTQTYNNSGTDKIMNQINYNIIGTWSSFGQDGTNLSGTWFIAEDGTLHTESFGYSDYYGKNIWMEIHTVKTPSGNYYSQNNYKTKRDEPYKLSSFGRAVALF